MILGETVLLVGWVSDSPGELDLLCEVLKVQLPDKKSRPSRPYQLSSSGPSPGRTPSGGSESLEVDDVDDHFGDACSRMATADLDDNLRTGREDVEAVVRAIHDVRPEPKDTRSHLDLG